MPLIEHYTKVRNIAIAAGWHEYQNFDGAAWTIRSLFAPPIPANKAS